MSNQTTGVNKLLLLSTLLLMSFGIVVVYTACTQHAIKMGLPPEYYLKKHCIMVLASLLVMLFAAKIDYSVWKKFSRVIFGAGCALTVYCLIFGKAAAVVGDSDVGLTAVFDLTDYGSGS